MTRATAKTESVGVAIRTRAHAHKGRRGGWPRWLALSLQSLGRAGSRGGQQSGRRARLKNKKIRLALYFCAGLVLAVALPRSTRITPLEHPTHFRYRNRNFHALVLRDTFLKAAKGDRGRENPIKALLFFFLRKRRDYVRSQSSLNGYSSLTYSTSLMCSSNLSSPLSGSLEISHSTFMDICSRAPLMTPQSKLQ